MMRRRILLSLPRAPGGTTRRTRSSSPDWFSSYPRYSHWCTPCAAGQLPSVRLAAPWQSLGSSEQRPVAVDGIAVSQMAQPEANAEEMAALLERIKTSAGLVATNSMGASPVGVVRKERNVWRIMRFGVPADQQPREAFATREEAGGRLMELAGGWHPEDRRPGA